MDFAPGGSMLASGGQYRKVILWNLDPGTRGKHWVKAHDGTVSSIKVIDQGRRLISAGYDGWLRIWDSEGRFQTGVEVDLGFGDQPQISAFALSRSERFLVSGLSDGRVLLWSIGDGLDRISQEPTITPATDSPGTSRIRALGFSTDETRLFVGAEGNVRYVKDLGAEAGAPEKNFTSQVIIAIRTTPGSSRVLTVDSDDEPQLKVWDTYMRHQLDAIELPSLSSVLEIDPSGKLVATVHGSEIYLWSLDDLEKPPRILALYPPPAVRSIAFDPSGERLVAGYNSGSLVVWDLESDRSLGAPLKGHTVPVLSLAFHPEGDWFVSGDIEGNLVFWDNGPIPSLKEAACSIARRNLSRREWQTYVDPGPLGWLLGQGYHRHCAEFPDDSSNHGRTGLDLRQ